MTSTSNLTVHPGQARGRTKIDWLDSRHTFSFGEFYNPDMMGFASLRVINDDLIAPSSGFGQHGHRDMEIISWLLAGELTHQDSLGHEKSLKVGEVQAMTAGKGILHSEYNRSPTQQVHLLQIWIMPRQKGLKPSYDQKEFPLALRSNQWCLLASPDGAQGSLTIQQDAWLRTSVIAAGRSLSHTVPAPQQVWLHVARGEVTVNGQSLTGGDAISARGPMELNLQALTECEVLCFDLA